MSSASCNQSPSQAIRDPSPASQIPRFASFRSAGHLPEQIASRLRADCEGLPFHLPTDRLHVGIPPARDVRRPRGTRLHLARVLLERHTHLMRGAIRCNQIQSRRNQESPRIVPTAIEENITTKRVVHRPVLPGGGALGGCSDGGRRGACGCSGCGGLGGRPGEGEGGGEGARSPIPSVSRGAKKTMAPTTAAPENFWMPTAPAGPTGTLWKLPLAMSKIPTASA